MTNMLIASAVVFCVVIAACSACPAFHAGKFAQEHEPEWTYAAANSKCLRAHEFQHNGKAKTYYGYFAKLPQGAPKAYRDLLDSMFIFRHHCASVCHYMHGQRYKGDDSIGLLKGVPFEDDADPRKVTMRCECGGKRSISIDMKRLSDKYTRHCLKTNV